MVVMAPGGTGQSRRHSAAESLLNVAIGYWVSLAAQLLIFPLFGIHVKLSANLWIGAAFTVVSLARSYVLRRAFNTWHMRRGVQAHPWPRTAADTTNQEGC